MAATRAPSVREDCAMEARRSLLSVKGGSEPLTRAEKKRGIGVVLLLLLCPLRCVSDRVIRQRLSSALAGSTRAPAAHSGRTPEVELALKAMRYASRYESEGPAPATSLRVSSCEHKLAAVGVVLRSAWLRQSWQSAPFRGMGRLGVESAVAVAFVGKRGVFRTGAPSGNSRPDPSLATVRSVSVPLGFGVCSWFGVGGWGCDFGGG